MPNFLTNIDWSSPMTIGIGIGGAVVVAVLSYLVWVWSKEKGPFER